MTDKEYKEYFKSARKKYRSGYDRMPIEELDLPVPVFNRLKRMGINVYGEIRHLPDWKIGGLLLWNQSYLRALKHRMNLFEVKKKPIQCRTPIETLGLDERTTFLLKTDGVASVEELTLTSAAELVNEFLGIRTARLRQIRQKLAEKGLALRDDPKPGNESAA